MKLDQFKALEIERDNVIEYTVSDENRKDTRLGYFQGLIEELPEQWREGHKETPYVEISRSKDKNGVPRDDEEVRLDDLLFLTKIGLSNLI